MITCCPTELTVPHWPRPHWPRPHYCHTCDILLNISHVTFCWPWLCLTDLWTTFHILNQNSRPCNGWWGSMLRRVRNCRFIIIIIIITFGAARLIRYRKLLVCRFCELEKYSDKLVFHFFVLGNRELKLEITVFIIFLSGAGITYLLPAENSFITVYAYFISITTIIIIITDLLWRRCLTGAQQRLIKVCLVKIIN